MRKILKHFTRAFIVLACCTTNTLVAQETTRQIWPEEYLQTKEKPKLVRPKKTAYKVATPKVTMENVAADSVVGVTIWRLRPAAAEESGQAIENGKTKWIPERVESGIPLAKGDHVRLSIEAARQGYLYVVNREKYADGMMGDPYLIFPTSRLAEGNNRTAVGRVFEIPAQSDDPPYFTLTPGRSDQIAEVLSIFITSEPLNFLSISNQPLKLSAELVDQWEKSWGKNTGRLEMVDGAGKTWTQAEKEAGTGTRLLRHEDPSPQSVYYTPSVKAGSPAFINVDLQYGSADETSALPWSRNPPGNLNSKDVPQFVSITFDDNFGPAFPNATGGMKSIIDFYKNKKNADGSPIKASFYFTSVYLVDDSKTVLGGKKGEDHQRLNRSAWSEAFQAGHEAGDHTVNHFNGGVVPLDPDDCCRARNWSAAEWAAEIQSSKDALTGPEGIGAKANDVIGFRAPYLGYNDHLFTALSNLKFVYDTSLPNCFDDAEDGTNCSWPYTLDNGSPDVEVLIRKFTAPSAKIPITFPNVTKHAGLWEVPPTTLIIPPDLRGRVAKKVPMPYPSIYEPSSGKIAGLDYTLLMDAGLTGSEMGAVLKYNLDLHLKGNRSPLVFIAHSHLYSYSSAEANPDTPTAAERDERWKGLTDFINYATTKPEVRIVSVKDLLSWMQKASK